MKKEDSNTSAERIVLLLILLASTQEGYSRTEIVERIPAYARNAKDASQNKMLDRDLSTLEKCGIHLIRENDWRTARYRVKFP